MFIRRLALAAVLAAGCSGKPGTVPVRGTVTVDGRPAPDGSIRFTPADGQVPSQAAFLKGGGFETELYPTKYEVRVSVPVEPKASAKSADGAIGGGEPTVGELLPAKYNVKTELSLTVTVPRDDVTFDLHTK